MRYEARIAAYDMLDKVVVTVRVWGGDTFSQGPGEVVLVYANCIEGVGESDSREWVRDVLVSIVESI